VAATRTHFIVEQDASVLVCELRGFDAACAGRIAAEISALLERFYTHVAAPIERRGGSVVKFIGDAMLATFVGADHRERARDAVVELVAASDGWVVENRRLGLPTLEHVVAAASGPVLVGDLGTDRVRFPDVVGAPVNLAFRAAREAIRGGFTALVDGAIAGPGGAPAARAVAAGVEHDLFRIDR
jgi:adenylate cyclase